MTEFKRIKEYASENVKTFRKAAQNAHLVKYGTICDGIGCLFPKAYKAVCKGRYGRYIKDHSKYSDHCIYEFSAEGRPLRLRKLYDGGCDETFYFFELDGAVYGACFIADTDRFFTATDIFKFVYDNSQLVSFGFFNGHREDMFFFDYEMYPHIKMTEQDKYFSQNETKVNEYVFEYEVNGRGTISKLTRSTYKIEPTEEKWILTGKNESRRRLK